MVQLNVYLEGQHGLAAGFGDWYEVAGELQVYVLAVQEAD